jgi:hypothetical protein
MKKLTVLISALLLILLTGATPVSDKKTSGIHIPVSAITKTKVATVIRVRVYPQIEEGGGPLAGALVLKNGIEVGETNKSGEISFSVNVGDVILASWVRPGPPPHLYTSFDHTVVASDIADGEIILVLFRLA